ncbi:MAG: hypothetical protein E7175_04985 [Erysipelotrichaceae bacterium]|nr:hypothetical protein [Erysipelotrichaceae bacterium]
MGNNYKAKNFTDYIYNYYYKGELYNEYDASKVPSSTNFVLSLDLNVMVGACNICHYSNDDLLNSRVYYRTVLEDVEELKQY